MQEMIRRVDFGVDPVAEAAGYNKMTTILHITLKDGRTISGRADLQRAAPPILCPSTEVAAKFLDCAAFAKWPVSKAQAVVEMVRKLEDVPDVRSLTGLLS